SGRRATPAVAARCGRARAGSPSSSRLRPTEKAGNLWYKVDRVRRMSMVSQLATAARNALSQAGRYSLQVVESAVGGTLKTIGGKETPKTAFVDLAENIGAMYRRMSKKHRMQLQEVLDEYPGVKAELLSAPIHDISLGDKASKVLMFFNRLQENVFRKMTFDAKMTALAKKEGVDFTNINALSGEGKDRLQGILEQSLDNALEVTFARTPKGKIANVTARQILDVWNKVPGLTTIQPFPRFWANAVKFLWDFNPTGFLTAAARATINRGGKDAYESMAKATTGTFMLGLALQVRQSEYAGEKWYQIKTGKKTPEGRDRYIDVRAFAPFSSYLFLSEAMLQWAGAKPSSLTGHDVAQGIIGINRISGTGLVLLDVLRTESIDTSEKMLSRFAGEYLGGFSVGARSVKDLLAVVNPNEAKVSATRERPLSGPFMENIPKETTKAFGYDIPEAERLTRSGGYTRLNTGLRQVTGITMTDKTPLEQEIDRLGLRRLYPKTGDPALDRKILAQINTKIETDISELVQSAEYMTLSDVSKKALIRQGISDIKNPRGKISVTEAVGRDHYNDHITGMKKRRDKIEAVKKLARKRRLSLGGIAYIIGQQKLNLSDKDKKEIAEQYR
ncbi:MAG: hypothetical protein SV775_17925, partial [Thermodesulfobacteriota bacterium]|nr:hypothetical protein [Thermodesulfobacteriota bacterium]